MIDILDVYVHGVRSENPKTGHTMNRTGTEIIIANNCAARPGQAATVVCQYDSPMGAGWLVRFSDGYEMAVRERDISSAPAKRKVLSFGR